MPESTGCCLNATGVKGNLEKAKNLYKESVKFFKRINNKEGLANAYGNLSVAYLKLENFVEAEKACDQSIKIELSLGRFDVAQDYSVKGVICLKRKDFKKAKEFFNRAVVINENLGYKLRIASNYQQLGMVDIESGDFSNAEQFFKKSLKIFESINSVEGIASIYCNIGDLYKKLKDENFVRY